MLFVPAGEVNIGTAEGPDDVRLIHKVPVRAFYMDKCEVANAQFAQFLNASGGRTLDAAGYQLVGVDDYLLIEAVGGKWRPKPGMDRFPMVSVTWYGAAAYARWAGKRLPTEAEWERAATAAASPGETRGTRGGATLPRG